MSIAHRYSDFGSLRLDQIGAEETSEPLEDVKLHAFENGYQAGWEDAVRAHETDRSKIGSDLAQSFQEMSFTLIEAQAKLMDGMKPLLEQMVLKLLPEIARESLGTHVLEQVQKLTKEQLEGSVEIAIAPENVEAIEGVLSAQPNLPFEISPETALSPGQVYIRLGTAERELNLDVVLEGISTAVAAFFHQTKEEQNHG